MKIQEVKDTRLFTLELVEDDVVALVDALGYYAQAEGGTNFDAGYPDDDWESLRENAHRARDIFNQLVAVLS